MTLITELYQYFIQCSSIATDTRNITKNCLFFALKGETFDGNTFAQNALEKGAAFVVVDNPDFIQDSRCLLVDNSLNALQKLATYHRERLSIPVIGLTGSNGKTTTKELLANVLSKRYKTFATKGNLNNHIGLPLSVLSINSSHEIAVIEMGANHQREIAMLCQICQPTHGLITNIGKAHLEGFGGIDGIKKGKGELFDYLSQHDGAVFINAEHQNLVAIHHSRNFKESIFYQNSTGLSSITMIDENPVVVFENEENESIATHLTGTYNFDNIATAYCVGKYFGVPIQLISQAIAEYIPANNRSQVIQRGSNTIWLDAYNANPSSMEAAIQNFNCLEASPKMIIIGDMFELGNEAIAEHEILGKLIAACAFEQVLLVGKYIQVALKYLPKAYYFPDKFGLHNWLQDHPQNHTHILIKGSRGMALESTIPFI